MELFRFFPGEMLSRPHVSALMKSHMKENIPTEEPDLLRFG